MIAAWMLYSVAVTVLLLAGASAADYVARALRAPTRGLFALAMIVAVALSARALIAARETRPDAGAAAALHEGVATLSGDVAGSTQLVGPEEESDIVTRVFRTARAVAAAIYRIEQSATRLDVRSLDRWNGLLVGAWLLASALALWRFAGSLVRVRRIERALATIIVHDERVLMSRDLGPALLGVLRSRIVLPEWVLALPARERDAIVAHEREHAAAHDPALFVAALLLVVLQPWNAALWALLARLHVAIEVDCDRRVLDALSDADGRWYGQLLIAVYERAAPGLSLPIGLVARPSMLGVRVRRIARRPRLRSLAGVTATLAALVLVLTACRAAAPVRAVAAPELTQRVATSETRCSNGGQRKVLWPGQFPVSAGCAIDGDIVVVYVDSTNLLVAARDTADVGVTAFFVFETAPGTTTPDLVWSTTSGRALLSDSLMSFASSSPATKPLVLRLWPAFRRTARTDVVELPTDNMMMAQMHGIPWDAIAQLATAPQCTQAQRESETMSSVIPRPSAAGAGSELRRACFVTNGQRFQFPIVSPETPAR